MSTTTLSKAKQKQLDADYAREQLLTHYLKEGSTVYTILRKVSSSGMSRDISLLVANDGEISDISYYAAHATGSRLIDGYSRAIRVQGAGMDMGFHLVYTLSSVLFKGEERAGYVLNHRWL